MPAQGEDDPAKRAVIHEWENWAALNSNDLQSPKVMIFFLAHLQSKKPVLLNFDCEDKYQRIRDWLVREDRFSIVRMTMPVSEPCLLATLLKFL